MKKGVFLVAVLAAAAFQVAASEARTGGSGDGAREEAALLRAFTSPPKSARPDVRWWWPGDAVADSEIRREIDSLDAAGFGGTEIQSFNPGIAGLVGEERQQANGYAEAPFFDHVRTALDAAKRRGLHVDYTFGSSWPSGGGKAITPEKALVELAMAVTPVEGSAKGRIKVDIPARTKRLGAFSALDPWTRSEEGADWRARFEAQGKIVSVMAFRGDPPRLAPKAKGGIELSPWRDVERPGLIDPQSRIDLTSRLAPDGTLDWVPPQGSWLVFVFKQYASNSSVLGASGTGPQLVLDHYDRRAFDAHAARVGDPLAGPGRAPDGLRATFVDSLELFQDLPWSRTFLAEFRARRGYDLEPLLPFVVQPGWMQAWGAHYSPPYFEAADDADLASRVRADYRQTVSDLLFENFLEPLAAWNRSRGLATKFQAHGGPIDILKGYGLADIPETEDLHDGGDPHFMRFARSAADIYGRDLVSAEAMVWHGRPYSVTLDEMRQRADLLYASGVNAQTVHGSSYRFQSEKWPGWFAFQPTAFGPGFSSMVQESSPLWAGVPSLTRYMARTNAVLRQGQAVVPVALFYGEMGNYHGIEGPGAPDPSVSERLLAAGYDYDRVNADGLAKSRVIDRQLVTPGGHRYSTLILPNVGSMRAEAAEELARFAEAGLPILSIGPLPRRETGYLDSDQRDARVRAATARIAVAGGVQIDPDGLAATLGAVGVSPNLRFASPSRDLLFVERQSGPLRIFFVHNRGAGERDASFVVSSVGRIERLDAMSGTRAAVRSEAAAGGMRVHLPLAAGGSALLVIDPRRPVVQPDSPVVLAQLPIPSDGWKLRVDGHRRGGVTFARDMGGASLGDWRETADLADFSGEAVYERMIDIPAGWRTPGRRIVLKLTGVHDMASVTINGKQMAPLITFPFEVDIGRALRQGPNKLEIRVANVPHNAMIDPKLPVYRDVKPVPAGLVGPLVLELSAARGK